LTAPANCTTSLAEINRRGAEEVSLIIDAQSSSTDAAAPAAPAPTASLLAADQSGHGTTGQLAIVRRYTQEAHLLIETLSTHGSDVTTSGVLAAMETALRALDLPFLTTSRAVNDRIASRR
jgi:hypothetical protein